MRETIPPREGTETYTIQRAHRASGETIYTPQGDGNHGVHPAGLLAIGETTHTPLGDGNASRSVLYTRFTRNNPHPARGRKL